MIKTTFNSYYFDTRNPSEKLAWDELRNNLKERGLECFETWGGASHYKPNVAPAGQSRVIELETKHLFDNQWTTAPIEGVSDKGLRVFDWALDASPAVSSKYIKRGHWLEQTAEMKEIRRNRYACGYCGKQEPAQKGDVFCPHCLDSQYLKESDLYLLRMKAVDDKTDRAPLSEAEKAHLLPLYHAAQVNGSTERGKARIAKARLAIESRFASAIANATSERDGARWIMDNVPGLLDNWIFYSHTGKHCFGWRTALETAVLSTLLDKISEFPFPYEIKCADGRTLSGN